MGEGSRERRTIKRILFGLSGTPATAARIRCSLEIARRFEASLSLISVVNTDRLSRVGPCPLGMAHFAHKMPEDRIRQSRETAEAAAAEIETRLRWQWRRPRSTSRRVDETYAKVRGKWVCLYRALDKCGNTIDCYLLPTRSTKAAKRSLGKALKGLKNRELPQMINIDQAPTHAAALAALKNEAKCPDETIHREVKYLNNIVEADHGKLKVLIRPVGGFKTLKTA